MNRVLCDRCAQPISIVDTADARLVIGGVSYHFHDDCWEPIAGAVLALLTGHRKPVGSQ